MLTPAAAREAVGPGPVLAFATRGPLTSRQIGQVRHLAERLRAKILILPLIAGPVAVVGSPQALIRATLAAMPSLPARSLLVPVPLPVHADDPHSQAGRARELGFTDLVINWPRTGDPYAGDDAMLDALAGSLRDGELE